MGKQLEGVEIGTETYGVSRISVAEVGLAHCTGTLEDKHVEDDHSQGHMGPGWQGVPAISHMYPTHET